MLGWGSPAASREKLPAHLLYLDSSPGSSFLPGSGAPAAPACVPRWLWSEVLLTPTPQSLPRGPSLPWLFWPGLCSCPPWPSLAMGTMEVERWWAAGVEASESPDSDTCPGQTAPSPGPQGCPSTLAGKVEKRG